MDYIMNAVLTSTIVGVGLPIIVGYIYYVFLGRTVNEAFNQIFSHSGVPDVLNQAVRTNFLVMFIWLIVLTMISVMSLIFTSFLISYYREADQ